MNARLGNQRNHAQGAKQKLLAAVLKHNILALRKNQRRDHRNRRREHKQRRRNNNPAQHCRRPPCTAQISPRQRESHRYCTDQLRKPKHGEQHPKCNKKPRGMREQRRHKPRIERKHTSNKHQQPEQPLQRKLGEEKRNDQHLNQTRVQPRSVLAHKQPGRRAVVGLNRERNGAVGRHNHRNTERGGFGRAVHHHGHRAALRICRGGRHGEICDHGLISEAAARVGHNRVEKQTLRLLLGVEIKRQRTRNAMLGEILKHNRRHKRMAAVQFQLKLARKPIVAAHTRELAVALVQLCDHDRVDTIAIIIRALLGQPAFRRKGLPLRKRLQMQAQEHLVLDQCCAVLRELNHMNVVSPELAPQMAAH
eukprot:comp22320_c0_seq1/m.53536 comp22320_c0_seq1/g.53536  ORF comp22320_c0_seq1/g.53536 comp22320_c0_seq1/m.53536 type:complete len:365 (-) comp22320_c0_seq1:992-2086(-)